MSKTTTEMQLVAVSKLVPYVNNARTHNAQQITKLRSSLREFGFINPVIIDREYNVIAGHGRILAAKEEGIEEVPCVFVDYLTPAQKKAYILADNRMAMDAGWDEELLRVEIEALQAESFDVGLTGFDEKDIAELFAGEYDDAQDDDFDVDEELQKPPVSKSGDVWLLGNHRLICGDSTKEETYAVLMDGKKANLVVTDPPYNVNYEGSAGKIQNDNMENDKFYQFLLDAFLNMEKAMADDASIYVFHADTEGLNFRKAFSDTGFYLSGTCIWKKQSLVLGRSPYQWQHEPCLYGWKKKGRHQWYSDRKQTTIWEFDKPKKNGDHPTMKPIPLIAYPIKNSSMSNCIILDPFGGSGSTLIACEQLGRICFCIELDEKYCDVIVKRYIEQVGAADNVSVIRDGKTIRFEDLEIRADGE
ncbi:site-specific DNA-methyltransferase [Agathobaculum sp. NTUH-O15-33]|uniref:site-specific DNA-methyltransferase n=1 Tax=Agathobaculum sp. NTUH-O15-33 TaxID=3079302 RepID=UPI0029589463|nr:site-specific DNA-methyltransferase [Agathobaculum sp. NTUH-O15-33]WNX86021.1 site-specific DNA-methyltransferase [Agathobaculum sp. NTUH-O15-33]